MKGIILTCFFWFSFLGFSQPSPELVWNKLWEIEAKNPICALDQYNNFYYTSNQTLFKVDSTGSLKFRQSVKSWGEITAIDARNPMKVLLFSEDQQTLNYLDNTLTKQQESIDLTDENFSFVTQAITSAQADKVWLFDSDNSRLVLFSRNATQRQQVDNVYGLLQIDFITQLFEYNTQLYIVSPNKGVFVLDRYGTLVTFYDLKGVHNIQIENDILWYLQKDALHFVHLKDKYTGNRYLPISDEVKQFYKNGNRFYFTTKFGIEVFEIK
ncbi:MAG TPA: hypothetical protein PLP27_00075 [Crocinitomicaceae bacterium]|nr:hypothetical protein [Crocinitomicaceae bacterium]